MPPENFAFVVGFQHRYPVVEKGSGDVCDVHIINTGVRYRRSGGSTIKNEGIKIKVPRFRIPGGTAGPFNYELEEGTETTVAPNISISKAANVTECGPGDYIEYTITIENKEDHEVEITIYDLIPDNAEFEPPVKANGDEISSEIVEDNDLNIYVKFKVTIPANST